MANNLAPLTKRRSFGFQGAEGEMFDLNNQLPGNALVPLITNESIGQNPTPQNYIQRTGGPMINLDYLKQTEPSATQQPTNAPYHASSDSLYKQAILASSTPQQAAMKAQQFLQDNPQLAAQPGFSVEELTAQMSDTTLPEIFKQRAKSAAEREALAQKTSGVTDKQRGQIIFDNQGRAFNVNPYTNEVKPVSIGEQQIQGAQYSPGLQGEISGAKAFSGQTGKAAGEATAGLSDMESQLPHLEQLVTELSALGKKATYTKAGQAADITRRQFGMDVGEGAVARKEYITRVDNEILPLLRQTFGAQFTQKEGEALKATLGDPDASPQEKDAVLKSFIQTKKAQVATTRRRIGQQPAGYERTATNPQTGQKIGLRGGKWEPIR